MKKYIMTLIAFSFFMVAFQATADTPSINVTSPNDTHIAIDSGQKIEIRWDTNVSANALVDVYISDGTHQGPTTRGKNIGSLVYIPGNNLPAGVNYKACVSLVSENPISDCSDNLFTIKATISTANWQVFNNSNYNYQIKYPQSDYFGKDYTIRLDSTDPKNVTFEKVQGLVGGKIFSIKVIPNVTSSKQLKTLLNSELFPLKSVQATSKVKTVNINIGGISGYKLTDSYNLNIAGFIKNKQAYIFNYSYTEIPNEVLYKNILASFKFTKAAQKQ